MSLEQKLKAIKAAREPASAMELEAIDVETPYVAPTKPVEPVKSPLSGLIPDMKTPQLQMPNSTPTESLSLKSDYVAPPEEKEEAKDTSERDLSSWLVGATPLLVGMLTGNTLEGVDTAANYYVKEGAEKKADKTSLQLKIEEMKLRREQEKLKREMAGKDSALKATNTIQEYTDPATGKVKLGVFDKASGSILETDYLGPKQPGVNDREARLADQFEKQQALREKFKLTDRQDKALKDFTLNTNSPFKQADDNINAIQRAHNLLNEGGVVGGEGVRSLIARGVFGEKGVLTENDIGRVGGDKSATARVNSLLQRLSQGYNPLPEDRKDLDILLRAAHNFELDKMVQEKDRYLKTQKSLGIDLSEPLNQYVRSYSLPPLKGAVLPARAAGQSAPQPRAAGTSSQTLKMKNGTTLQLGQTYQGYKWVRGDGSKPTDWEKQ